MEACGQRSEHFLYISVATAAVCEVEISNLYINVSPVDWLSHHILSLNFQNKRVDNPKTKRPETDVYRQMFVAPCISEILCIMLGTYKSLNNTFKLHFKN